MMELKLVFCALLFPLQIFLCVLKAAARLLMPQKRKDLGVDVVLITGGGRGIGRHLAKEFAKQGAKKIILWGRTEKCLRETCEEISMTGTECHYFVCDVGNREEVYAQAKVVREKLRKPIVEKMRRDRINNCIDQLKKLLEKEICSQDPNTKLEKADILEMTVSFLKQQHRIPGALAQSDYNQGYSRCWKESLHFLNSHSNRGQSTQEVHQRSSTELSNRLPVHSSKHGQVAQHQADKPVWRPW